MKIFNIGSLNIDFTYEVEHFVCPGETIKSTRCEVYPGGKGLNQSIALAKAGAHVYHVGMIGTDGEILKDELDNAEVDTRFIRQLSEKSGHAIIQVDKQGQNCIIVSSGTNAQITNTYIDAVMMHISKDDIVLLQNEVNNIAYIIHEATKKECKIALNPSPINSELFELPLEQVDYFILNEIEAQAIIGEQKEDVGEIMEKLREIYPQAAFVLTLGEKGAVYFDQDTMCRQHIYPTDVVDTTAAGDTFCGYFLAHFDKGNNVANALQLAASASSICVSRKGASTSIPALNEVEINMALKERGGKKIE